MEVASSVAGLIALADLVVSKTIKYSLEVKNSTTSITTFLAEATSLLGTLKAIEHTSKIYMEHGVVADFSAQTHIDGCNNLLQQIRSALKEPDLHKGRLKKLRRQLLWPFDSAKTMDLVASLERQKQSLNLAFNSETWLASIQINRNQSSDIKTLREVIQDTHLSEEHRRIYKWLGDVDHANLQQNGIAQRSRLISQTGKWFIEGYHFTRWLQRDGAKLWVHGIPGAGKTILASTIIEEIQSRIQYQKTADMEPDVLVYFYCDFRNEKTTVAWNIVGSLVKQLSQQNRQCLHQLEDFYSLYNPRGQPPKPCDAIKLSELLQDMAQNFSSNLLIVVDGLDEIEHLRIEALELLQGLSINAPPEGRALGDLSGEQLHSRPSTSRAETPSTSITLSDLDLTTEICLPEIPPTSQSFSRRLSTKDQGVDTGTQSHLPSIKLLFLSRTLADIEAHLHGFEQEIIEARLEDLRLYVASELDYRVEKGKLKFAKLSSLKEDILDRLVNDSHGMYVQAQFISKLELLLIYHHRFRWVACQIDFICSKPTDKMKRAALDQLPRDLPQTYDRILRGVDKNHMDLVHKTLQWIIYAAEPLPVSALLEALAVEDEDVDYDETAMADENILLQCCSSLVKKSRSATGCLELAHFSVKQYLLSIDTQSPPEIAVYRVHQSGGQLSLARTCLTYLNFETFERGPAKTLDEYQDLVLEHPFLYHASQYWYYYAEDHFTNCDIMGATQRFFNPEITGQFRLWNQCALMAENDSNMDMESETYKSCMEASPLHWATLFTLPEVAEYLLEEFSPNLESGIGKPVHCALIGRGSLRSMSVGMTDFQNMMSDPDLQSFLNEDYKMDADFDIKELKLMKNENAFQDFLAGCTSYAQRKTIKGLRDRKAITYTATRNTGVTEHSSHQTRLKTVKLLIDRSADIRIESEFSGLDPLDIALLTSSEEEDFVSPLLLAGAKITSETIHLAKWLVDSKANCIKPGVRVLLRHQLDTSLPQSDQAMFFQMVEDLQSLETEISTITGNQTLKATSSAKERISFAKSLMTNVKQGVTSKVKLRLQQLEGSPLADYFSDQVREAFHLAVDKGWREVVHLFLRYGVQIDREAFSCAVQNGASRLVNMLLDHDPQIARQEDLFTAIKLGDHDIFFSLLRIGIHTASVDRENNLPIHKALENDDLARSPGREIIINELVSRGPLLTAANSNGELPIHFAAWLGLEKVVQNFLERDSPFETECNDGFRPTHHACFEDSADTLELLIQRDVDVNARRSGFGEAPLHLAAEYNAPRCTQVLIDAKADLEQLNAYQKTPLVVASLNGSWNSAEVLIRAGANIHAKDPETNSTIIHEASAAGIISIVDLVLEQQLDVELQTLDGKNALFFAAANGHVEVVDILLQQNARVDAGREGRGTPLHAAISGSFTDIVKLLLDHGPNLECLNSDFETPLMLATKSKERKIIEMLVLKGANVNFRDSKSGYEYTPFLLAAKHGFSDLIKLMIDNGANVNDRLESKSQYTAVMLASTSHGESLATIKILVEKGADVKTKTEGPDVFTALLEVLAADVIDQTPAEIVEYLLENGANACDTYSDDGTTVLMEAVIRKDTRIVRALLAKGAQINTQAEPSKNTALFLAISTNQPEMCKILLDRGPDLSLTDDHGKTVAHAIAETANIDILRYFLAHNVDWKRSEGAEFRDPDNQTQFGISPLHVASINGFTDFITHLWEQQLLDDLDVPCGDDIRALHWAAANGHSVVAEALLARGADINAATRLKGHTPLQLAALNGHSRCVNILLQRGALVNVRNKLGRTAADLTSEPGISQALKSASNREESSKRRNSTSLIDDGIAKISIAPEDPRAPELRKACEKGEIILCRQLLSLGVEPNGGSVDGRSLLQTAIQFKHESIASLLIDKGADIHRHAGPHAEGYGYGYQAIHYAVWHKMDRIVQKLLDKGARMSDFGLEPVHIAAFQGSNTTLTKLLEFECGQAGGSAQRMLNVQIKVQKEYPRMCLAPNVYAQGILSTATPLHLAAYAGQINAISILIDYGADVDCLSGYGLTPLRHAIGTKSLQAVKALLDAGANISSRDASGNTHFIGAVKIGNSEIIDELLHRSMDITTTNMYGRSVLYYAARYNNLEVLKRLCDLGLSFDQCDIYGSTPLDLLLRSGTSITDEVSFYIIDHTSLLSSQRSECGNLLNISSAYRINLVNDHTKFIKRILVRFSKEQPKEALHSYVNNYSTLYGTPLYCVSYKGAVEAMDILLDAGAEVESARGPHGSALNAACATGRVDAIKWLLRHGAGPVSDEAMQLASAYPLAIRVLNRYKDLGLQGLDEEPVLVLPKRSRVVKVEEVPESKERPGSSVGEQHITMTDRSPSITVAEPSIGQNGDSDHTNDESPRPTITPILPAISTPGSADFEDSEGGLGVSTVSQPSPIPSQSPCKSSSTSTSTSTSTRDAAVEETTPLVQLEMGSSTSTPDKDMEAATPPAKTEMGPMLS
ncbi:Ankyrin-3 [Lachnellula arida]|uniref:Ankyrin-3 n=1 Tax=Lachnellula arida TaxID=1316785 RepID=A0A8T9B8B9_9HELO|nr:Ankyrin-3 [Lachnellula arida]